MCRPRCVRKGVCDFKSRVSIKRKTNMNTTPAKKFADYNPGDKLTVTETKEISTCYGPSHLLKLDNGEEVWSNKKVTSRLSNNLVQPPFDIHIGMKKSFEKDGQTIHYQEIHVM